MEQEKRQKEITRHGLIRVGLWLGGGWLLLVLCAAGVLPHMEPDRYSWLLAGAVTILFGAELLLWQRGRRAPAVRRPGLFYG